MRYKPVEKFFIKLKGSSASVPGGGGGAGRQSAPPPKKKERLPTGKFLLTYREKICKGKKGKLGEKEGTLKR